MAMAGRTFGALALVGLMLAGCQTVLSPDDPRYCSPENGYRTGRVAASYNGACAGPAEADFLFARGLGLEVYNARTDANDARNDIDDNAFGRPRMNIDAFRLRAAARETQARVDAAFFQRFGRPLY
jgi:hypothetical protein